MTRRCLLAAGWLFALLLSPGGLLAQPPEIFSEELVIREREILVDPPDDLAGRGLQPEDFRVRVDGQPREVTRAERARDWTIVLYVDEVLATPGSIFYSGLALANRARELTRAGTVEVAVAGPDPHPVLQPTRDAHRVEQTLVDLAAAARVKRDRSEALAAAAGGPSAAQIRRQLEKLVALLADRRPAGPHAVILVADGPDLPPEQAALVERRDPSGIEASSPAAAFHRAARLLAAYGWVAIPIPLRKEGAGMEIAPQREIDIFREGSAPSDHQNSVPPIMPGRPPAKTTLAWTGVIEFLVEPKTAALRVLSRATAGTVIGFEQQIGPLLAALSRRWRLWIAEPEMPLDGRLHSLEVSLADQFGIGVAPTGLAVSLPGEAKTVRAPQWIRTSTPEPIAELRLANLLAGQPAGGDLPVEISLHRTPSGLELRLALAPGSTLSGPVRLSWGFPGEEGVGGIRHVMLRDMERGWRHSERIAAPPGIRRMAVVVEALGAERWRGAVLEMPGGGS
jgi:hypothetical protein